MVASSTLSKTNEKQNAEMRLPSRELTLSHLGKRKIIFKMPFFGDMLVPWRVPNKKSAWIYEFIWIHCCCAWIPFIVYVEKLSNDAGRLRCGSQGCGMRVPKLWHQHTDAWWMNFLRIFFCLVFQDLSFRLQQKIPRKFFICLLGGEILPAYDLSALPKRLLKLMIFFWRVQGANFVQGSISKRGRKVLDNSHTWRIMLGINGDRDFPK